MTGSKQLNAKELSQRREALGLSTVALSSSDLPAVRLLSITDRQYQEPVEKNYSGVEGRAFVAVHVSEGECEFHFKKGHPEKVAAGQLFLMNDAYLATMRSLRTPLCFYWYEFIIEKNQVLPMHKVFHLPLLRSEARDVAFIKTQLLKLTPWACRRATARFLTVLTEWLAELEATDQLPPTEDLIERAIQRMNRVDGSSPNMSDLAAEAGQHISSFNRIFKRRTGITPKQFQSRVRNQLALELLLRGDAVGEVARKLGYFDSFHFSHAFSSNYRFPPSRVHEVVEQALASSGHDDS